MIFNLLIFHIYNIQEIRKRNKNGIKRGIHLIRYYFLIILQLKQNGQLKTNGAVTII
jgi:hypothetical protein